MWDRTVFGETLAIIKDAGVRAVACDILFVDETYNENDTSLLNALGDRIIFPVIMSTSDINPSRDDTLLFEKIIWNPVIKRDGVPPSAQDMLLPVPCKLRFLASFSLLDSIFCIALQCSSCSWRAYLIMAFLWLKNQ